MKKLIILLLLLAVSVCKAQQGDYQFPGMFVGTWTNAAGNDTIVITNYTITWHSNTNEEVISYVDVLLHTDDVFFSFNSRFEVYNISIEKVSRLKLRLFCQTLESLERCNDEYYKTSRQ